jgi:outer membrane protein assembly factor BamC
VTRFPSSTAVALATVAALAGCGTYSFSEDKIDYRSATPAKPATNIEVPPDLTQLTKDNRYQQIQSGSVSAAALQSAQSAAPAVAAASGAPTVAVQSVGAMRIEKAGDARWLHTTLTPEQLWPQLQAFWVERGFVLKTDEPVTGVMETDWAEDRGKLPMDFVRKTIGKVFDNAFSTGSAPASSAMATAPTST